MPYSKTVCPHKNRLLSVAGGVVAALAFFALGCNAETDAKTVAVPTFTPVPETVEIVQVEADNTVTTPVPALPTVTPSDEILSEATPVPAEETQAEETQTEESYVEEPPTVYAEKLCASCKYEVSRSGDLTDDYKTSYIVCSPGRELKITWDETVPARSAYLQFSVGCKAPYTVRQYDINGALLEEGEGPQLYNNLISLREDARGMSIVIGEEEATICTLHIYGEGAVANYHPWKDRPEKADYMVIATHADDDVLFLGAIIPIYGVEQGREGVQVISCCRSRSRMDEGMNGAWTMGLRSEPIFLGFKDNPSRNSGVYELGAATKAFVRLFRQYKPDVVVTQDPKGEYGHWQHKQTVAAVELAVQKAADPSYDKESAEEYGTWQVKKLYMHLLTENQITLDIHSPLSKMGGKSVFEIAEAAYACHVSQVEVGTHAVREDGVYDLSAFGLKYSAVGPDTEGVNDMFEHID